MEQGAHRCGALHGVGQPGEQRKLGALADDAAEDQKGGQRDHAWRQLRPHRCRVGQHRNIQGAQLQPEQHQPQQKGHIAGSRHHKCFFPGFAGAELVEPEPDEQVGSQPHQLPEDVNLQQRAGDGKGQHGPGEEGHAAVIATESRIPGHVAQRVDLHQKADCGHHGEHRQAQRIQQDADGNCHLPGNHPDRLENQRCLNLPVLHQQVDGRQQGQAGGRDGDGCREPVAGSGGQHDHTEGQQGQQQGGGGDDQADGKRGCRYHGYRCPPFSHNAAFMSGSTESVRR